MFLAVFHIAKWDFESSDACASFAVKPHFPHPLADDLLNSGSAEQKPRTLPSSLRLLGLWNVLFSELHNVQRAVSSSLIAAYG